MFSHPNREFSEREIANMIKMSPNTINLALKSLRKTNIFNYKRIGNTHIYKCNQNSVLFEPISDLFSSEKQIRTSLFKLLKEKFSNVQSCIAFGSYANESEDFESDLDILIVIKNTKSIQQILDDISGEVLDKFGTVISPILMTPGELKINKNKPYVKEALLNGRVIIGKTN